MPWKTTNIQDLKNLRLANKQLAQGAARHVLRHVVVNVADQRSIDNLIELASSSNAPFVRSLEIMCRRPFTPGYPWRNMSTSVLDFLGHACFFFEGLREIGHYSSETEIQSEWHHACGTFLVELLKQGVLPKLTELYGLSNGILGILGESLAGGTSTADDTLRTNISRVRILKLSTLAPLVLDSGPDEQPAMSQKGLSLLSAFTSSRLESLTLESVRFQPDLNDGLFGFASFNGTLKTITLDFCRGEVEQILAALRPHQRSLESIDLHKLDLIMGTWSELCNELRTEFSSLVSFRCNRGAYLLDNYFQRPRRDRTLTADDIKARNQLHRQVLANARAIKLAQGQA